VIDVDTEKRRVEVKKGGEKGEEKRREKAEK